MREIYYNSDITPKAENEIKLLALYYDKINIVNDAVYTPTFDRSDGRFEFAGSVEKEFVPQSFRDNYKLLINENLIELTKRKENDEDEYEKSFAKGISNVLNSTSGHDLIFPIHPKEKDGRIITEEVYDIMKHMRGFEWGDQVDSGFIWWYYSIKLKWFLKLLIEGKNCISSSNNLNGLFSSFIKNSDRFNAEFNLKGYKKSLALDALKISLPNPDVLSFEDILELKLKLKDELGLFYQTINEIEVRNKELFNTDMKENEYQALFFSEIQKPFKDLEIKMKNLQSRTFRGFIDKMKDIKSHIPLIGTVVASTPIEYSLLAAIGETGVMTLQSYLEHQEGKREIASNNGLYFLLKIR